jgi:hypothetical protein
MGYFFCGMALGFWRIFCLLCTAYCIYTHAWVAVVLWSLASALAGNLIVRPRPIPMLSEAEIGDRIFERMAARVDARR